MADAENVDITLAEVARRLSHSPRWLRVILAYDPSLTTLQTGCDQRGSALRQW
ncbi:MAG TPA: hypothetical protein VNW89_03520 [Stellaceae bacterium]|nr:hypothetical protein [Stellaceae bacterium]